MMNIKINNDKEIRRKCEELQTKDEYYVGPHKVMIRLYEKYALVLWYQGGLITNSVNDCIKVKRNISTFFGLRKVKSFEERLQEAADKMQIECDRCDALELENRELVMGED